MAPIILYNRKLRFLLYRGSTRMRSFASRAQRGACRQLIIMIVGKDMEKKEKKWSVYFQNPDFLEKSRMLLIPEDMKPLVRKWCGLKDGMRILDVGCGTGFFTRLMVEGDEKVTAVGVDLEEPFIDYAKKIATVRQLPIDFITGDAFNLPFEADSFDIVTSHTFFTNIPDPERAMAEMKRVVRPGGKIVSVTPMSYASSAIVTGDWPEECTWIKEFQTLYYQFYHIYNELDPFFSHICGVKPEEVPKFFSKQGLKNICIYPLGKVFSLSNAAISKEDRLKYIDLYQSSEEKKLDAFMLLPEMSEYTTPGRAERFRELLAAKCDWLRNNPDENSIWEWEGDSNILLVGDYY